MGVSAFVAKPTLAILREVKAGRRLGRHCGRGLPVPMQRSNHGGSVALFALQVHRGLDDLHEVRVGAVGVTLRKSFIVPQLGGEEFAPLDLLVEQDLQVALGLRLLLTLHLVLPEREESLELAVTGVG